MKISQASFPVTGYIEQGVLYSIEAILFRRNIGLNFHGSLAYTLYWVPLQLIFNLHHELILADHLLPQIKTIIRRTLDSYIDLFNDNDSCRTPLFKMELILDDDDNIQFYPMLEDLEDSILSVVRTIIATLQSVQTVQVVGILKCCTVIRVMKYAIRYLFYRHLLFGRKHLR